MIPNPTSEQKTNKRNLVLLGLVSMFIDISTEMVYPIIPLFLVSLGTAPYLIGVIESVAEGLAALLRTFAGYLSDKFNRKKPMTIAGYSASIIYKVGLLLSASWVGVLISKIMDRTGKGLRTAPRDSLVAESGGKKLGGAFGFHKMMDMLGAAIGVLLAYIILTFDFEYKTVILYSIIPAVIGVAFIFLIQEPKRGGPKKTEPDEIALKPEPVIAGSVTQQMAAETTIAEPSAEQATAIPPPQEQVKEKFKPNKKLILYLIITFIFSLGTSSKAFLLLKAQSGGFNATSILLLYLLMNATASVLSVPFGLLSDKVGRKRLLLPSYILYALVYFGFAFLTETYWMLILFFLYGVFTAMISGAERAMLVEMSPLKFKGTVLGWHATMQGLGLLLSSTIAGVLWSFADDSMPFIFGAALAGIAAILFAVFFMGRRKQNRTTTA